MKLKNILLLLILILVPGLLKSEDGIAVRIAVFPLEVFSIEKDTDLGNEIAVKLSKRLGLNPYILTTDFKLIQSVLAEEEFAALSREKLKETAKVLEANYLLLGSITRIEDEMSIDVQVYNNFSEDPYYKTFAEGTDTENIIEEIAGRVKQEVLAKADLIPPAQRPQAVLKLDAEADEDLQQDEIDIFDYEGKKAKRSAIKEEIITGRLEETEMILTRPALDQEQQDEPFIADADRQMEKTVLKKRQAKPVGKEAKKIKKRDRTPFESDQPININADSMEYDNKKNRAVFKGNVVARQGNIVMFADHMEVVYGEKGGLKEVYALGNVKIIQDETIATGQKIVFYNDQQKIVVTGSPRVWQGDNVVHGKKITVFLKEERTIIDGGPQDRASATIYPRKMKSKKD